MTVLYIALIVIAVIGLLLLLPITAVMTFSVGGENEAVIRYLFIRLRIYPPKPKEEKAEKSEKSQKPEKPKRDIKGYISMARVSRDEIRGGIVGLLHYIIKHAVIIKELNISAEFGFDDAMKTGLAAGAANAAVYNIIALLERNARLRKWSADLKPNFEEPCVNAGIYCRLNTRTAHAFALGAILLKAFIKIRRKIKKIKAEERKNEQSD